MYYDKRRVNWTGIQRDRTVITIKGNLSSDTGWSSTTVSIGSAVNDFRSGVSVPNWSGLIRNHQDASSGYTREDNLIDVQDGNVVYETLTVSTQRRVTNMFTGPLLHPSVWPTYATGLDKQGVDDEARSRCLSKAYSKQTKWQSGVFFGEVRELERMFRHPMKGLVAGLNAFLNRVSRFRRTGKRGSSNAWRRDLHDAVTDTWLQTMFGLLPFVSDIDDASQALLRLYARKPVEHARGEAFVEDTSRGARISRSTGGGPALTFYPLTKRRYHVKYVTGFLLRDGVKGTLRDFGADFRSFVPTIYNLIPYSFVLDYVTNVGEMLEALSFDQSSVIYVNKVVTESTEYIPEQLEWTGLTQSTPTTLLTQRLLSPGSVTCSRNRYQRNQLSPDLMPSFRWQVGGLKPRQWGNLVALGSRSRYISQLITGAP